MINIKKIRKNANLSQLKFAELLNVHQTAVSQWEQGRTIPDIDIAKKISLLFNVSLDYILENESKTKYEIETPVNITLEQQQLLDKFNELNIEEKELIKSMINQLLKLCKKNNNDQQTEETEIYIDYYDLPVSAGSGVYLDGNSRELEKIPVNDITKKANFALRVSGDSMNPEFSDGDTILIKSQPVIEIGEMGIFIYENEGYFKKWGGDKLISLNPKYEPIYIKDHESFYCKGKVLGKL